MLCELRRRGLAQLPRQSTRNTHPFAINISARFAPAIKRGRVIHEIYTDLGQHGFRVGLNDLKRLFVENLKVGDIPLNILGSLDRNRSTLRTARSTTTPTAPPTTCFCYITHGTLRATVGHHIARDPLGARLFSAP